MWLLSVPSRRRGPSGQVSDSECVFAWTRTWVRKQKTSRDKCPSTQSPSLHQEQSIQSLRITVTTEWIIPACGKHTRAPALYAARLFPTHTHWHFQCLLKQGPCGKHFAVMYVQLIAQPERSLRKSWVIKQSQICKDGQRVHMGGDVSQSCLLWCCVDYCSPESVGVFLMRSHDRMQSL